MKYMLLIAFAALTTAGAANAPLRAATAETECCGCCTTGECGCADCTCCDCATCPSCGE